MGYLNDHHQLMEFLTLFEEEWRDRDCYYSLEPDKADTLNNLFNRANFIQDYFQYDRRMDLYVFPKGSYERMMKDFNNNSFKIFGK